MGMSQSISGDADTPLHTTTPASPSSSPLNLPSSSPSAATATGASSLINPFALFVTVDTPHFKHHHLSTLHAQIKEISEILAIKVPPELVPRILEEARVWHGCRTMCTREVCVVAGRPSPRRAALHREVWVNGQEEEMAEVEGLKDKEGNVWVLVSGKIGCKEGEEEEEREGDESLQAGVERLAIREPAHQTTLQLDAKPEVLGPEAGEQIEEGEEEPREEGSWLREIIIETLSKDQGWSTGEAAQTYYGRSPCLSFPPCLCLSARSEGQG
jgi:hypothetical protein